MVSLTGTAGAAAPSAAAAVSTAVMTASLTKGRAASWMATNSPSAAARPLRTLSARVAPPCTTVQGFVQRAAMASHSVRLPPQTSTSPVTAGCAAKASQLVCKTVRPSGRRKLSLSNPIRRDAPAATTMAVTAGRFISFMGTLPPLPMYNKYYTGLYQKNPLKSR